LFSGNKDKNGKKKKEKEEKPPAVPFFKLVSQVVSGNGFLIVF